MSTHKPTMSASEIRDMMINLAQDTARNWLAVCAATSDVRLKSVAIDNALSSLRVAMSLLEGENS